MIISFKNVRLCFFFYAFIWLTEANRFNVVGIDERWICNVKLTCIDCLQLPQCSWCPTENKCFSEHLPHYKNYCSEDMIRHPTYGLSLLENAACACAGKEVQDNCPPGEGEQKCSGRGKCLCGRCFCDVNPDPMHPTKIIIGDNCEYDNFSCDGPDCDEGPYNIFPEDEQSRIMDLTEKS